jgi:hypothetical protein
LSSLPWSLDAFAEHLNRLRKTIKSSHFPLSFSNPAAVFLAVGVAELLEECEQPFLPQLLCEFGWHFDGSDCLVLPNNHFDGIAGALANLFANRLEDMKHVASIPALHERSAVGHIVEGGFYGHRSPGPEFLFNAVWKNYSSATANAGLNGRFEFVFLH